MTNKFNIHKNSYPKKRIIGLIGFNECFSPAENPNPCNL